MDQNNIKIPLFPIYGYDNQEEAERDFDYMKQLYPRSTRLIQELIEDACDRLEYEGSILFDEYPDRLQVALMAGKIYRQIVPLAEPDLTSEQAASRKSEKSCHSEPCSKERQPDWMRNLIEVMLCNEMCARRRRYRSRKVWMM